MKIQLSRDVEILGSKDPTKDVDIIGSEDPWIPGCGHTKIQQSQVVDIQESIYLWMWR